MGFEQPEVGGGFDYEHDAFPAPEFSDLQDYESWLQEMGYEDKPVVGADYENGEFPVFSSLEDYKMWVQEVQCDECVEALNSQTNPIVGR